MCSFSHMCPESTIHLLSQCQNVADLWINIENWIKKKLNIDIQLNTIMKTIGYHNLDEHYWPLNFILLLSRYYIYRSSKN